MHNKGPVDGTISGFLQQPQDQGKAKGLAACNSQTASPFGCLNNFYFKILSNFWGSLQMTRTAGFDKKRRAAIAAESTRQATPLPHPAPAWRTAQKTPAWF